MHTFFFGNVNWRADKMKKITVFYYGEGEGEEAKRLAAVAREGQNIARTMDAAVFDGLLERCSEVVILPGVAGHQRRKIEAAYGLTAKPEEEPSEQPQADEPRRGPGRPRKVLP